MRERERERMNDVFEKVRGRDYILNEIKNSFETVATAN